MTATELAALLAQQAIELCRELLPNGKEENGEYVVGSVNGDNGKSLKIKVKGSKAGVWKDFAGSGEEKGDLIGLIIAVKQCSLPQACEFASKFLGVANEVSKKIIKYAQSRKTYVRPVLPATNMPLKCSMYLINDRKLSESTLDAYKIFGLDDHKGARICFPFYSGGECYLVKSLFLNRDEKGKKIILTSKNSEPCLFGWQAFDGTEREVIITEGEIDAMSWLEYGYKALSVPFGATNFEWIELEFDRLSCFDVIYVASDMDDKGNVCAKTIAERLGKDRCRRIKMPLKDMNECLIAGYAKAEVDQWVLYAEGGCTALRRAEDFYEDGKTALFPTEQTFVGFKTPWEHVNRKIILRPSELSIWQGINGHGKSMLLGEIMLAVMEQGGKVCIASLELKIGNLIARLAKQATGKAKPSIEDYDKFIAFASGKLFFYDCLGIAPIDDVLAAFKEAYTRYGVTTFLLDSFMMLDIAEDDYGKQKKIILKLCEFKSLYECHIHLVVHPRKQENELSPPTKMSVLGSGSITNLADTVFTVWRNKKKEYLLQNQELGITKEGDKDWDVTVKARASHDVFLYCEKDRHGSGDGSFGLWYDRGCYQYREIEYAPSKIYVGDNNITMAVNYDVRPF